MLGNIFRRSKKVTDSKVRTMPAFARENEVIQTSYTSDPIEIIPDFLTVPASDCRAITLEHIDFSKTDLPEYEGCFAVVLENVLSPSECATLLALAEKSATTSQGWRPAMVNAGGNFEALATDYRNSDRIIWDNVEMVDRLWKRCCTAPGLAEMLSKPPMIQDFLSNRQISTGDHWRFSRLNDRMRFLRYGPGQFFKRHCDGTYETDDNKKHERSFYTFHLYLSQDEYLEGGATTFHPAQNQWTDSKSEKRLNVDSKVGRVLIFQHRRLLHSGDTVLAGIKHTMRTDIMFETIGG